MNVEFVTVQVFFLTYAIALAKKWTVKVNAVVKLEKMSVVIVKVMVSQKDFVIVKVVQLIAMVFVLEEWKMMNVVYAMDQVSLNHGAIVISIL